MPDLVTHLSAAYFANKALKLTKYIAIFYLGTILPDILTRPFYILQPRLYWFVYPLHTPITLILVCLTISYLFEERIRKDVFISLSIGVFIHLALDVLPKHLIDKPRWLFPFSQWGFEIGLFWPDDSVYAVPFLLIGVIIVEIITKRKKGYLRRFNP